MGSPGLGGTLNTMDCVFVREKGELVLNSDAGEDEHRGEKWDRCLLKHRRAGSTRS